MERQSTIDSYSAAVADGLADAWDPEERASRPPRPAYPTADHDHGGVDPTTAGAEADADGKAERYTTFGYVEYRPRE